MNRVGKLVAEGKDGHPKLDKLKELLAEHFGHRPAGGMDSFVRSSGQARLQKRPTPENTRVIVFAQWRDCVAQILRALKDHPAIRAVPFVGQASTKSARASGGHAEEDADVKGHDREESFNPDIVRPLLRWQL